MGGMALAFTQATLLLRMLAYLSESIKNAFMVDELRARTAQMLGYFLDHLVGKKGKDLKARGRWSWIVSGGFRYKF